MSEWRALCEVAETNPETLSGTTSRDYRFKYIDLSAVEHGRIEWNGIPETRFIDAPSRARRVVRPGDVLFGTVRPGLQSHGCIDGKSQTDLIASTGFSVIRAIEGKADPRYLRHYVLSTTVLRQALNAAVGSNYPAVNDSDVQQFRIFAPALAEQSAIARILDTLDTQIEKTQALIAKLEQVKEGLLRDLLTRGVDEDGELRPSAEEAPELYKESALGWIPREWEAIPLAELVTWSSGGTPSRAVKTNWLGTVPLLTPKDMKCFELHDTSEHVSDVAAATGSKLMLAGTVFVVVRGMILAHSFPVVLARSKMAFNQDIKAATTGMRLDKVFFAHWLSANKHYFLKKVTESTHGTKKLDMEALNAALMLVPPLAEQAAVVSHIQAFDQRIERERDSLSKLATKKSGLMDDLLTGRVRVTPLLDREPAEAT